MPDKNKGNQDVSPDELIKQLKNVLGISSQKDDDDSDVKEEEEFFDDTDEFADIPDEPKKESPSAPVFDTSVFEKKDEGEADDTLSGIFDDTPIGFTNTLDTLDGQPKDKTKKRKKEFSDEDATLFPSIDPGEEPVSPTVDFSVSEADEPFESDDDMTAEIAPADETKPINDEKNDAVLAEDEKIEFSENDETKPIEDKKNTPDKSEETEPISDEETKPIDVGTSFVSSEPTESEDATKPIDTTSESKEDVADKPSDITPEEFNQTFGDEKKEEKTDENGYTESDKGVMDAFEQATGPSKEIDLYDEIYGDIEETEEDKARRKEREKRRKAKSSAEKIDPSCEFISNTQRKPFIENYKRLYRGINSRITFTFFMMLFIFILEALGMTIGSKLPHFMNTESNPKVFVLILLQLFLICCAFAYKSIFSGFKTMFSSRVRPESLCALSVLFTVGYAIFNVITISPSGNLSMYFSPSALCIFCALLYEKRNLKREIFSFKVASSVKTKYVLEKYKTAEEIKEQNDFYDYLPEDADTLKINKTEFIENFISRQRSSCKSKKSLLIFIPILIALFVILSVSMILFNKPVNEAIPDSFLIFTLCMPCAAFAGFSLPFFKSSKLLSSENSAIIGEAATDEFGSAAIISFEDKEVFPFYGIRTDGITAYSGYRTDYVMHILTNVFKHLGGPLSEVFANAAKEVTADAEVRIMSTSDNGIEAMVGKDYVLIGSSTYMIQNNYTPDYSDADSDLEERNEKRIMYVVSNGNIITKIYLKYTIDKDFTKTLAELAKNGMCVAIKTFDPNIDTDLLSGAVDINKYPVRVLKCSDITELSETKQNSVGNIVSTNSVKSLSKALSICKKTGSAVRTNLLLLIISFIISIVISVFAILTRTEDKISSLYIVLYQLLWIILTHIITAIG